MAPNDKDIEKIQGERIQNSKYVQRNELEYKDKLNFEMNTGYEDENQNKGNDRFNKPNSSTESHTNKIEKNGR